MFGKVFLVKYFQANVCLARALKFPLENILAPSETFESIHTKAIQHTGKQTKKIFSIVEPRDGGENERQHCNKSFVLQRFWDLC